MISDFVLLAIYNAAGLILFAVIVALVLLTILNFIEWIKTLRNDLRIRRHNREVSAKK